MTGPLSVHVLELWTESILRTYDAVCYGVTVVRL
jgi:hypothetical protein